MIALRYFCGFSLQIFSLCIFLFVSISGSFPLKHQKMINASWHLSIFIVMVIPFSLIAQFNIGGDYKELIWNVNFLYCPATVRSVVLFYHPGKIAENYLYFFVVMSYGFFVTSTVTIFAPYFPVSIRLFYVSALCTGSHTYHKSGSCETISHTDGANPYYD